MWRACQNSVPTKLAVEDPLHVHVRRTIIAESLYERRHGAAEDPLHALWSCSKLDVMWSNLELWGFRSAVGFVDFKEVLSWIIMQDKNLELFAFTAWTIWNNRNKVRMHQPAMALHQVVALSCASLFEFQARQVVSKAHARQDVSNVTWWLPPSLELVKINFNGAVFAKENRSDIGVVIRNDEGLVIASCSKKLSTAYFGGEI